MSLSYLYDPAATRAALAAFFPADVIQARPGAKTKDGAKALVFFYIDARAVMDRLDDVFGVGGWRDEYQIALDKNVVVCRIGAKLGDEWVYREDVGVHAPSSDKKGEDGGRGKSNEDELDMKYKGVFSDAFKRCAVKWGVGRYLYDIPQSWAPINQWSRFDDNNPPRPPVAFLPKAEESPVAKSKKAADWICNQYEAAKTAADLQNVDKVIQERGGGRILIPVDFARADNARERATDRISKIAG